MTQHYCSQQSGSGHQRTWHPFTKAILGFLALVMLVPAQLGAQESAPGMRSYEEELSAWHARRLAGLKRPQGWLSLVALDWLKEGTNSLESIGTITVEKETITLTVLPTVKATVGGKSFTSGALQPNSDRVDIDSRTFTIIKRGERYAVRMWDSNAETLKQFAGIDRFPASKKWRIEARWQQYDKPKPIKVASVIPGFFEDYNVPGIATFSVNGNEYKLEPVESGGNSLFFIFADETNSAETYGAGRFLYTDMPKDGTLIIDFNKATNPPCAFTPYATCPLPPEQNRLQLRVEAGEKKFGDH